MKNIIFPLFISLITVLGLLSCREQINVPEEDNSILESDITTGLKEITQPSIGTVWNSGDVQTIKWKVNDNYDRVKISLIRKSEHIITIINSTNNDGLFNWTVPRNLPHNHHFRIKLSSGYDSNISVLSDEFDIF
jgi:hypothetical protein